MTLTYETITCPHPYYPNKPEREVKRFVAKENDTLVGQIDYFVEGDCSFGLRFWIAPEYRNGEVSVEVMKEMYRQCVHTPKALWYGIQGRSAEVYEIIAQEFPHITLYASGPNPMVRNEKS